MAKDKGSESGELLSEAKVKSILDKTAGDLKRLEGMVIGGGMNVIVQLDNGVLNVDSPAFQDNFKGSLESEQSGINLKSMQKTAYKIIDEREKELAEMPLSEEARQEQQDFLNLLKEGTQKLMQDFDNNFVAKAKTNEGFKELAREEIKRRLLSEAIPYGPPEMYADDKVRMIESLQNSITIPDTCIDKTLYTGQAPSGLTFAMRGKICEFLSTKDEQGNPTYYIDREKWADAENVRNFCHSMNNSLNNSLVAMTSINALEERGLKLSNEQQAKISEKLGNALSQLSPNYLDEYKGIIADELTKSLNTASDFRFGGLTKNFTISDKNLDKVCQKFMDKHVAKSDTSDRQYIIDNLLANQSLKDKDITAAVNAFKSQHNSSVLEKFDITKPETLVALRKVAPHDFDVMVKNPVAYVENFRDQELARAPNISKVAPAYAVLRDVVLDNPSRVEFTPKKLPKPNWTVEEDRGSKSR